MTWLTEDPTGSIMMGSLAILFFGALAFMLRKAIFVVLAVLSLLITIALVTAERMIVTDREQLRSDVHDLADAVQNNDVDRVLSFVSRQMPGTRSRIQSEMPQYEFRSCRIVGFNEISIDPDGQNATVAFVVLVDVNAMKTYQYDGTGHRRVELMFRKEPEGWKIVNYAHYNPQVRARVKF